MNNRGQIPGTDVLEKDVVAAPAKTVEQLLLSLNRLIGKLEQDVGGQNWSTGNNAPTDGNGNLTMLVATIPQGYRLSLKRAVIWADGKDPGNVYSAATAWLALFEGMQANPAQLLAYAPAVAGGQILPIVLTFPQDPQVEEGNRILLRIAATAAIANTNISVFVNGELVQI